ncbi:hypothetical protein NFI96_022424, partial [Prochilodus magdalenae]
CCTERERCSSSERWCSNTTYHAGDAYYCVQFSRAQTTTSVTDSPVRPLQLTRSFRCNL